MKRRSFVSAVFGGLAGVLGLHLSAEAHSHELATTESLAENQSCFLTGVRIVHRTDGCWDIEFSRDGGITWTEVPWVDTPKTKVECK